MPSPIVSLAPRLAFGPAPFAVPVIVACLLGMIGSPATLFGAGAKDASAGNPLLERSPLPLGYPRFDLIRPEHFGPAFAATMAAQLKEVEAIANNPEAPTCENTLAALERAAAPYERVRDTFNNLVGAHTNPALRAIETDMAPKFAAHSDAIRMNAKLLARIEAVRAGGDAAGLDPESKQLVERYHKDFVRAGARLSEDDKAKLRSVNQQLAALQTKFAQNVQNESNADAVVVADQAELDGLSPAEIEAASAAAKAANQPGRYLINLVNTSGQPPLASLTHRGLRQRIMAASLARCSHGGENDNREIVATIVRLRCERARLLGFATHADYVLADQTAGNVATVNKLLADLARPAVANARREAADIQAVIDAEHGGFTAAACDWDFYTEKVRNARYAFDESALKPYFELNHVLVDGVFYAANRLYGISFHERHDLPVYEPSVRVFDVTDADGSPLAIFISDLYARPSKRGGAWMNAYVTQSALLGQKPVIANHLNIPAPPAGQPTLLTFDEVTTLFHEFGHALHGMFSQVKYPRLAGTAVPRDFVEYPSQVNEMWATWPEVLTHYARHYQTGEPMPAALLEKVLASRKFNQGFATTEYLAASLLDQAWHQLKAGEIPAAADVPAFEAAALKRAGVDFSPVPPRYRSTYFLHIFKNDYSAGYYSYIWAEVLDADSVEWFKAHGGLTRANGDHFRKTLLSRGGSAEAMELFRTFAGREPYVEPLLKRRGLEAEGPDTAVNRGVNSEARKP